MENQDWIEKFKEVLESKEKVKKLVIAGVAIDETVLMGRHAISSQL